MIHSFDDLLLLFDDKEIDSREIIHDDVDGVELLIKRHNNQGVDIIVDDRSLPENEMGIDYPFEYEDLITEARSLLEEGNY